MDKQMIVIVEGMQLGYEGKLPRKYYTWALVFLVLPNGYPPLCLIIQLILAVCRRLLSNCGIIKLDSKVSMEMGERGLGQIMCGILYIIFTESLSSYIFKLCQFDLEYKTHHLHVLLWDQHSMSEVIKTPEI